MSTLLVETTHLPQLPGDRGTRTKLTLSLDGQRLSRDVYDSVDAGKLLISVERVARALGVGTVRDAEEGIALLVLSSQKCLRELQSVRARMASHRARKGHG